MAIILSIYKDYNTLIMTSPVYGFPPRTCVKTPEYLDPGRHVMRECVCACVRVCVCVCVSFVSFVEFAVKDV